MAGLRSLRVKELFKYRVWRLVAVVEAADEIPPKIPKRGAVLVGSMQQPKWLAFDCPCDLGHRIMVNLDPAISPFWKLLDVERLTVLPSFNYSNPKHKGRCHFIIDDGRIIWVRGKRTTLRKEK